MWAGPAGPLLLTRDDPRTLHVHGPTAALAARPPSEVTPEVLRWVGPLVDAAAPHTVGHLIKARLEHRFATEITLAPDGTADGTDIALS